MQSIERQEMTAEVPWDRAELGKALIAQREYTLALYADLPGEYWQPRNFPRGATVNPALWELAHIAWFQEFFALRWRADDEAGSRTPSCLDVADQLFDSRIVAHDTRWQLAYPSKGDCFDYMRRVLDLAVGALVTQKSVDRYGFQLALVHEDMHAEALAMTLRTLGLPLPDAVPKRVPLRSGSALRPEIACVGGTVCVGAQNGAGASRFSFDNEKPAQVVDIAPFAIDARVVSAGEFAEFVASDAYREPRFWSAAGNTWRESRQKGGASAAVDLAAIHVSYFEAQAYCLWKNRRLPTEMEWEHAATSSADFLASTGQVWEWTASAFGPYPGFEPERYREYSSPSFASEGVVHRVLKGGSFVTHPRLKYPQYRNFYSPERTDMFCGFRTCAIT